MPEVHKGWSAATTVAKTKGCTSAGDVHLGRRGDRAKWLHYVCSAKHGDRGLVTWRQRPCHNIDVVFRSCYMNERNRELCFLICSRMSIGGEHRLCVSSVDHDLQPFRIRWPRPYVVARMPHRTRKTDSCIVRHVEAERETSRNIPTDHSGFRRPPRTPQAASRQTVSVATIAKIIVF